MRTVVSGASLTELRAAAGRCTGCDLYRHATQMVFGQGPLDARVVLVGEQPGDQEDRKGAPFVGPAGEVLDRALGEAGLDRQRLYVTNAVKHFKFVERGKRRIHQTPRLSEIAACRPWLEAELGLIEPETLVGRGATAARALFGPEFRAHERARARLRLSLGAALDRHAPPLGRAPRRGRGGAGAPLPDARRRSPAGGRRRLAQSEAATAR